MASVLRSPRYNQLKQKLQYIHKLGEVIVVGWVSDSVTQQNHCYRWVSFFNPTYMKTPDFKMDGV
ncbi:MAG: hypothetical protein QNJ63_20035 [Calothrix sp. MO_192.B10]|nr:hypothetical protein [Calothrix sp. MO_192.B10]